jgi:hypothetical protein
MHQHIVTTAAAVSETRSTPQRTRTTVALLYSDNRSCSATHPTVIVNMKPSRTPHLSPTHPLTDKSFMQTHLHIHIIKEPDKLAVPPSGPRMLKSQV